MVREHFLGGLPVEQIVSAFSASPGNEITSGKFASAESSAQLVANAFGFFLNKPQTLPRLPGCRSVANWPPISVRLEAEVRFPWAGGRHPWLDVLVETSDALIGIESKRFEPFRNRKASRWSKAYWRDWGIGMEPYSRLRDELHTGRFAPERLDPDQLVKHAFGLRTEARRKDKRKRPVLIYLYHEPKQWPDGRSMDESSIVTHRSELQAFARKVKSAEVVFRACTYRDLVESWMSCEDVAVNRHALALRDRFQL